MAAKLYARQLRAVQEELDAAVRKYGRFNSAHEGFAIIMEELDELKAEVWKKPKKRRTAKMRREAAQLGAMAIRFMMDVCDRGER